MENTVEDIVASLRAAGLESGDIVLVHSSLSKLGVVKGISKDDKAGFTKAVYQAFAEVLNIPEGTLVVPTFTHEYARNGVPFVYEESPSEVGAFTEYVRTLPGSLRSVHPICSFAAIGKKNGAICADLGISCYGYNSVFDRLINLDAKMLFFGASMRHMTLKHHMEHIVGLPYSYHKAYFTPAHMGGKPLPLPFLACVRYLNGKVENDDCSNFRRHLEKKGLVIQAQVGNAEILCMPIREAFTEAYSLLQNDPCYFLEEPYFETS